MADSNASRWKPSPPTAPDDGSPRMVTLIRANREIAAVGAADADDAARQALILILQQDGGLRLGDEIRITRI